MLLLVFKSILLFLASITNLHFCFTISTTNTNTNTSTSIDTNSSTGINMIPFPLLVLDINILNALFKNWRETRIHQTKEPIRQW